MFSYVFHMFSYVFLCFPMCSYVFHMCSYVFLCFPMFSYVFLCFPEASFSRERRAKGSRCVGNGLGPSCSSRRSAAALPARCRRGAGSHLFRSGHRAARAPAAAPAPRAPAHSTKRHTVTEHSVQTPHKSQSSIVHEVCPPASSEGGVPATTVHTAGEKLQKRSTGASEASLLVAAPSGRRCGGLSPWR